MSRPFACVLLLALVACGPTRPGRDDRDDRDDDCTPTSCEALGKDCGEVDDGCGDTLDCGTCAGELTCGGGDVANVCGAPGGCQPETDAQLCARYGLQCGPANGASDNCGLQRTVASCGACGGDLTCGGGGVAGVCGKPGTCTAETDAQFCSRLGKACGTATGLDNCGAQRTVVSCGSCGANGACGIVAANQCCTREPASTLCAREGTTCGPLTATNGCGERVTMDCGPCTQAGWTTMSSPTTRRLWEVQGSSSTNVWAVGEAGTVVRFDGTQWSTVPLPTTANVNALAVLSPTNVIVSTQDKKLLHWNGSSWIQQTNPVSTSHYGSMWVQNASSVHAAGLNGAIVHWNGVSWSQQPTPWGELAQSTVPDLYAVWGTGTSNIWAVGPQQRVVQFDGSFWGEGTPPPSTVGFTFVAVWGTGPNNMILFGSPGSGMTNLAYRKGSTDYGAISVALSDPKALHGVSGTNVWAVGGGGETSHWDGVNWLAVTSPTTQRLDGVWAASATEAFAVGMGGTILRYR